MVVVREGKNLSPSQVEVAFRKFRAFPCSRSTELFGFRLAERSRETEREKERQFFSPETPTSFTRLVSANFKTLPEPIRGRKGAAQSKHRKNTERPRKRYSEFEVSGNLVKVRDSPVDQNRMVLAKTGRSRCYSMSHLVWRRVIRLQTVPTASWAIASSAPDPAQSVANVQCCLGPTASLACALSP